MHSFSSRSTAWIAVLVALFALLPVEARASTTGFTAAASRTVTLGQRQGFSVRGRIGPSKPFNSRFIARMKREATARPGRATTRRAAEFGTILALSGRTVVVRWTPWQTRQSGGTLLYRLGRNPSTVSSAVGIVTVPAIAWIETAKTGAGRLHRATSLAGLRPGMRVFVGGTITQTGMNAAMIVNMAVGTSRPLTKARMARARIVRWGRTMGPRGSQSGEFTGGGPKILDRLDYNFSEDFTDDGNTDGVEIFNAIDAFKVYVKRFDFLVKAGATTYDWPFTFSATDPGLYMTENGNVPVQVTSQQRDDQATTMSVGFGIDFGLAFHIYTVLGCGDVGLSSCEFNPKELHLGWGMINSTSAAAPLSSGTTVALQRDECANIAGINIPDTDLGLAALNVCADYNLGGAPFQADLSATGATNTTQTMQFDGSTAQTFSLTPTQAAVGVTFNNFQWVPTFQMGMNLQLAVVKVFKYNFPTINFSDPGGFPMVGSSSLLDQVDLEQFSGPSSETVSMTAQKEPTSITYSSANPVSVDYNDPVQLSATLYNRTGGVVAGKSLTLTLNGTESCSGLTNSFGTATCSVTPKEPAGAYSVSVSFAGDNLYAGSSTTGSLSVTTEESGLAYGGVTTQQYHDVATVSATLLEDSSASTPIAGRSLAFTIGSDSCTAVTNSSGVASCGITLHQPSGGYTASVAFAGDSYYKSSSTSSPFTITTEETTLTYTGDPLIANNRPAVLRARLLEDGTTAPVPAGQTVTFTLGSGASTQTCQGQTAADGSVSCTIATVNQPLGTVSVGASFAGDQYYQASADAQQRLVFSYLATGGGFALGDGSVRAAATGTSLTWWGARWSTLNLLSGGAAPASFKGFGGTFFNAGSPVTDPVCGGTWAARPGDSLPGPAAVPTYMAVVVPSAVSKSGSTITGTISRIVIVKTDTGYDPNSGHAGTGTVVATLCGQ